MGLLIQRTGVRLWGETLFEDWVRKQPPSTPSSVRAGRRCLDRGSEGHSHLVKATNCWWQPSGKSEGPEYNILGPTASLVTLRVCACVCLYV